VFVSGQLPIAPDGTRLADAPFERQAQQVLDNVRDQPDTTGSFQTRSNMTDSQSLQSVPHSTEDHRSFRDDLQRKGRDVEPEGDHRRAPSTEGERSKGKIAEQKVIGRGPASERRGEGHEKGGNKEGANSGLGNRFQSIQLPAHHKSLQQGRLEELGQSAFLQNLKSNPLHHGKKMPDPTVLSKALIDEIVRYVAILTKRDGEKEMRLTLHEKVFKGLRLRVAVKRSRAEVTFLTESGSVRELFLSQRGELRKALEEKGIEVQAINVIMI